MEEEIKINNPIEIKENSQERVAFDLMKYIHLNNLNNYKTEEEIMTLYHKCWEATCGQVY